MKKVIFLFLLLTLIISYTACATLSHSGDESANPTEDETTKEEMTEEETTKEEATEEVTTEEVTTDALLETTQAPETSSLDLYKELKKNTLYVDLYGDHKAYSLWGQSTFDYILLYTLRAPWEEKSDALPQFRLNTVQHHSDVYIVTTFEMLLNEYYEDDDLVCCSIYFRPVVDAYIDAIEGRGTSPELWDDADDLFTDSEFAMIFERYLPIFESNGVYAIDPDPYEDAQIKCVMSKEQIFNFSVPNEEFALIITVELVYK